jgi:hypothetical protein
LDGSDEARYEKLKTDIKGLQSKGVLVKMAYGGQEWGNTFVPTKVSFKRERAVFHRARSDLFQGRKTNIKAI